jgi:hypothetical protein
VLRISWLSEKLSVIFYRINLEQKYIEEHVTINKNLAEACNPSNTNGVQKSFLDYVGLSDTFKPIREQYIEKLKAQREELIKFRVREA